MQSYSERSTQVALESSIAVLVLLNPDNTDMEFWALKPHQIADTPREEFVARRLRSVGVIGLKGIDPAAAFKEPLDARTVNAIAGAFLEYLRVLIGDGFADMKEAAEIAELGRLWLLPDNRIN